MPNLVFSSRGQSQLQIELSLEWSLAYDHDPAAYSNRNSVKCLLIILIWLAQTS